MATNDQVFFFDTTLRDGEQSPGCTMHTAEKLRLAHQLAHLGVDVLEAGFPVSSEGDFAAVQQIAREVKGPRMAALARAKHEDIEYAARSVEAAAKNRIHVFLSCSDLHMQYKLKITRAQAEEQAGEMVRLARTYVDDVEFSPEDATRTDPDFLVKIVGIAIAAGATVINIPDTVGYTVPEEYAATFTMLRQRVPGIENITLSAHCHDDLGLAVANSLAAVNAGARQIECTINGIGERAGNAPLEEIAAAMMVRRDKFPYHHELKLAELYPTSNMLASIISFGASPNKAVVGANAFAHESGIHQHGMLANPLCYEIMTPESVGVTKTNIVLGKHSGRKALDMRLRELGHELSREELEPVYYRFTELTDRKKNIYDQDLLGLLHEVGEQVN